MLNLRIWHDTFNFTSRIWFYKYEVADLQSLSYLSSFPITAELVHAEALLIQKCHCEKPTQSLIFCKTVAAAEVQTTAQTKPLHLSFTHTAWQG